MVGIQHRIVSVMLIDLLPSILLSRYRTPGTGNGHDNVQEDRSRFHGCVVLDSEGNIQHEKKFPVSHLQETLTFCFYRFIVLS